MTAAFNPRSLWRRAFNRRWIPGRVAGVINGDSGNKYGIRTLQGSRDFRTLKNGQIRTFKSILTDQDRTLPNGEYRTTPAGNRRSLGSSENLPFAGSITRLLPDGRTRTTPAGDDRTLGNKEPVSLLSELRCLSSGGPRTLIDGARLFRNELQTTVVPEFTFGSGTATYVGATTKTFEDFEGIVRDTLSGEPRFKGARRVENLVVSSEDMRNGAYGVAANAVVSSATQVTYDGSVNGGVFQVINIVDDGSGVGARSFIYSVEVKLVSGTISGDADIVLRVSGSAVNVTSANIGSEVTTSTQRFAITATTDAAGTQITVQVQCNFAGVLEITEWQLEEITGNTITTPSEYRKSGIETGPEINTDLNASSISNETDATTGWGVGSGGLLSSVADTDGDSLYSLNMDANGGGDGRILLDIDSRYGLTDGQGYKLVMRYRKVSGNNSQIHLATTTNGEQNVVVATVSNTSYATVTYPFTHSSTTRYLILKENGANNNAVSRISTISIKKDLFGDQSDSVEYFKYANGNTVSSNVVTELTGQPFGASEFHNDARGPFGYLAEGQRQNRARQSNGFDTTWVNSNTAEVPNYAVAPDGRTTAWRLIDDSGAGGQVEVRWQQGITVASGSNTFSFYAKADQLSFVRLTTLSYDAGGDGSTYFDLAGGTVETTSINHTAQIESLPNSWYRVSVTFSTTSDLAGFVRIALAEQDNDSSVDDDGTSSILGFGAQVESGAFPSSYIPTLTSAVTRNADVLTYDDVGNISDAVGTVFAEVSTEFSSAQTPSSNIISAGADKPVFIGVVASDRASINDGTGQRDSPSGVSAFNAPQKVTGSWGSNITAYWNGDPSAIGGFDGQMGTGNIGIGVRQATSVDQLDGTVRYVDIYGAEFTAAEVLDPTLNPAYVDAVPITRTIGPSTSIALGLITRCLPNGETRTTPAGDDRTLFVGSISTILVDRLLPNGAARTLPSGESRSLV